MRRAKYGQNNDYKSVFLGVNHSVASSQDIEIGLAGVTAALSRAVYQATGIRVRDLPIKIKDLLTD